MRNDVDRSMTHRIVEHLPPSLQRLTLGHFGTNAVGWQLGLTHVLCFDEKGRMLQYAQALMPGLACKI